MEACAAHRPDRALTSIPQYDVSLHHISTCFQGISTIEHCMNRVVLQRCHARARVVAEPPSDQTP